jgi:signal transduction histidine kinase/ligand-binding sensor domain-containing protein/DNA-binding NarL/FixJ family response regulator
MKKTLILLFLLPAVQAVAGSVHARESFADRYNVTYVTMENGLLHDFVDDIYKDSQGFLWISTGGGGLLRYDGYTFTPYTTDTNRVRLKSNFIRKVCEDDFGRVWIVSEGGIDILSLTALRQVRPGDRDGTLAGLADKPAAAIAKDSKGCIWIYCGGAIRRISFDAAGDIDRIHVLPTPALSTQTVALHDADEDGNIWAGIGNAAYKLYPDDGGRLSSVVAIPGLELEAGAFISVFLTKENEVWIGTNQGLLRHNRNGNLTKRYAYGRNNRRSLTQDFITDLAITADKQLLVSTLRGLNVYNPISDDFEQIMQQEEAGGEGGISLNSNFLNCLLTDHDMIWIGSETGGINKITPRRLSLRSYTYSKDNPHSLSRNPVNAVYEDAKGTLWVGTVEGGLNRKLKGSDTFTHYTSDAPAYLSHNSVSALTADDDNRLWVGTWGNGITLIHIDRPEQRAMKYISSQTHPGFPVDFIGSLCYDAMNKGVWIGANPGIYFYDLVTDKICSPFDDDMAENVPGAIGTLIDTRGRLWMGSMEGVYLIDLHSRTAGNRFAYTRLKHKLDEPDSHLIEKISCFHQAGDGTIWVGSYGYGLYKYLEEGGEPHFVSYTTEQGLINNNVRGILEDDRKRLWISTNNGLSCFDASAGRFMNYTREDGLPANQFYWNAHCRSQSGLLYFGGLNGLVAIEGNRQPAVPAPSKVRLTRLRIMNDEVYPDGKHIDIHISMAETLRLHESDKSFSIEFSALNFDFRTAAIYKYRLLGFDDEWIETPANRRFASYTNLKHGDYVFQVMYLPEGGTVDTPVTELAVTVSPFFYKSPLFILLMVVLAAGSTLYFIRTLQQQKELLHRTVEERTQELARRNEMLVLQNEKITRQKSQLIKMSGKVQELTTDKLAFFTNITHEFRTPVTLIIGPIERALKLSYNPQVIEQLNFVERNSKYLLSLVNQLMDFRKIESGKLEINRTKSDFLRFIDLIITPFAVFAGERNITIRKFYRLDPPEIRFDQDAMQKVITNLLSNAIKFMPDGGTAGVYIAALTDKESGKEKLYISITDTGTGIAEEDLTKIFNRFYQSADGVKFPAYGQSGTGIGLYLSKRIVQMHGGTISARNNRRRGASFRIILPLSREEGTAITRNTAIPHPVILPESPDFVPSHFSPSRLTMLIVEDNRDMRGYIRSILSEQYNILEAENGAEALTILSTCNVDFIISDLMMPVMDGIELSREVKENFAISHIPFLMLTAKTSQESRIESYRTGVDEYLLKPFNEELLLTRITNILENRKRYQRRFALKMDIDALNIEEESSDRKFLNKALETIKANYKNPVYEATDFIEAMGVSKTLLNRKMNNLIGQSAGQFIRNYRLTVARELIEKNKTTRSMNVSEIAYEVGFNDPKYFTRCFTKRYNIPPSSLMEGSSNGQEV